MTHPLVAYVRERVAEYERECSTAPRTMTSLQFAAALAALESGRLLLKAHDDGREDEIGFCPTCWYSTPGSFRGEQDDGDEPPDEWHRTVMPCPTLKAYSVRWSHRADYLPQWRPGYGDGGAR